MRHCCEWSHLPSWAHQVKEPHHKLDRHATPNQQANTATAPSPFRRQNHKSKSKPNQCADEGLERASANTQGMESPLTPLNEKAVYDPQDTWTHPANGITCPGTVTMLCIPDPGEARPPTDKGG